MKKRLILFLMMLSMFSIVGCDNTTTTQNSIDTTKDNIEDEFVYAKPENNMGLTNLSTKDLQTKIDNKETFYLYIKGDDVLSFDFAGIENSFKAIIDEYSGEDVQFCYIDENLLQSKEFAELNSIFGHSGRTEIYEMETTLTEDGGTSSASGISTHMGVYAFKEGSLVNEFIDFSNIESKKMLSTLVSFVFESDLYVLDHNIELISYEDVLTKIENNEKFILYVGRETCRYCHAFTPALEKVIEKYPPNIPIYYLYTQKYKTAINNEEENAQQTWDDLKASLQIEYTPSLIVFENGTQTLAFGGGVESDYFDKTKEEQAALRDEVADVLEQWFANNKLSDACADGCD